MTLDASPEPDPPASATRSGVWKYSAIPLRSPSAVEPMSHINRKNAIIAVTKSAYAIFQAPPWWPPATFLTRLMMIGARLSSFMPDYFLARLWQRRPSRRP